MIVRAQIVVTIDGPPIENGAVAIREDQIVDVGKFSDVRKAHSADEVVDLGEQALLPGLINAHCHLDYTCLRGKIPRQKSFTDWIRAINAEKAQLTTEDYVTSINDGFAEARRFGTTTIANLTAFPELISQTEAPIRTWWFAELIDVREPISDRNLKAICNQVSKASKQWGLAPHAPFTASADLYRRCEKIARRENILLTTHLAESGEEMQMFQDGRGPLYDFLKEIGREMTDCGKGTPVEHFLERAIEGNRPYLLVHLNEIADSDLRLISGRSAESTIVHCARSHSYFGHSPFRVQKLSELGFNICLGTDSLASNDDLSLFAEMRAFQNEFPDVQPEEILKMVTVNSARALQQENALGRIRRGFIADFIAVPIERSTAVFETILEFDGPIVWSMIGGRISP
jgi:cytosine/adenosine deaminase-related metal-dependent hydrolase